jgi:integrase
MPKASFYLKRPQEASTSIYMLYQCSDGKLKYYIDITVKPSEWDATNQVCNKKGVNARIAKVSRVITDHEDHCGMHDVPVTKQSLRSALDQLSNKEAKQSHRTAFEKWNPVIDGMKSGLILTPLKKVYSNNSILKFEQTIKILREFEPTMKIETTTRDTYDRFITWAQGKNFSTNSIGAFIKCWKRLGTLVGGTIFDSRWFKKITEETYKVYLSEVELRKMIDLKLSERETVVRDWFILGCYTGLRVSDLAMLSSRNYREGEPGKKGTITVANKKTDERVIIPANKYVRSIIKNHGGFPPKVSDIEINRIIKKVAKKAGITTKVLFTITKGGKRVDRYVEKWQLVSTHTGRRSFITNLRKVVGKHRLPDSTIMKLAGIRSGATLQKYDKLGLEEAADDARKTSFFL